MAVNFPPCSSSLPPYEINNSKYQKRRNLSFVKKCKDKRHRTPCGDLGAAH
ncbi:MAG: hypothetical protein [Enterobacteria phage RP5]|nr:MAG: hypothetical protein [Enterobacteria phage RP5]